MGYIGNSVVGVEHPSTSALNATTGTFTGALTQDGGAVFNEASADVDFRVESDNLDDALFVQGSDGMVGIGTNAPAVASGHGLQINNPTSSQEVRLALTHAENGQAGTDGLQFAVQTNGKGLIDHRENADLQVATNASVKFTFGSDGNYTLSNGNLVLGTSGNGISFAATSDTSAGSMANELFDDYEEGTWTPTLGGNASYTGQTGRYTKIGRYVQADFDVTVNVLGTGSGSILQGLPFTVENSGGVFSGHVSFYTTLAANVMSLDCYAIANTDDIYFTGHTSASGNIGNNLTIFQNSARVLGTVHYFAA